MINASALELVDELRRLLALAETDEPTAFTRLHQLIAIHGRETVGAALTVAAPHELAALATSSPSRAEQAGKLH